MHFAVLTTTVIYATYAGGVLFALLAFGRWSDAIGRRPVLLAGVVVRAGQRRGVPGRRLGADAAGRPGAVRAVGGHLHRNRHRRGHRGRAAESWRTRAAAVATVANIGGLGIGPLLAGLLVEYAPQPLHLSFIVHIVLARAGRRRRC